jgi:hypothetical protein
VLEGYQAFNDPNAPLESLTLSEQNRILNELSASVDADLRQAATPKASPLLLITDSRQVLLEIAKCLDSTATAFVAQCRRRDRLVSMIQSRLGIDDPLEYESFFFHYYAKLSDEERFHFEQIRAMTEGPLHNGNQSILSLIEDHPQILKEIPRLAALRQHLVFWLNKYDKVFSKRTEMCLLYTGVEDGVPFPGGLDQEIESWVTEHC